MRVEDTSMLSVGDRVRCRGNGPLYVVKALPVADDPLQRVGIWHKIAGWKAWPFSRLILVKRALSPSEASAGKLDGEGALDELLYPPGGEL